MRQPHPPVAEIRKRDDPALRDPEHPLQYPERIPGLLQSLAEDRVIERAIGIIVQRRFQIALIHGNPARDSFLHACAGHLDAARIYILVFAKPREELALAAPQVEHASLGLYQLADDGVVAASVDFTH